MSTPTPKHITLKSCDTIILPIMYAHCLKVYLPIQKCQFQMCYILFVRATHFRIRISSTLCEQYRLLLDRIIMYADLNYLKFSKCIASKHLIQELFEESSVSYGHVPDHSFLIWAHKVKKRYHIFLNVKRKIRHILREINLAISDKAGCLSDLLTE